jgi:hypothetical protein
VLRDVDGEPLVGAAVVATSPALVGEQVVISDERGYYHITTLPPGAYTLTIYRDTLLLVSPGHEVLDDVATVAEPVFDPPDIPVGRTFGTVITVELSGCALPPPGRTFSDVLGATADSHGE